MLSNIGNINDILIKMMDPAEGAFKTKQSGETVAKIIAQVIDVKGEKALLRWVGGRMSASIETPVTKGEHLLLEYYAQRGERSCYRIIARSESGPVKNAVINNPVPVTHESTLWSFLVSFANQTHLYPVLIKYYPSEDEEGSKKTAEKKILLEVAVETKNLGIIMIRLGISGDGYYCNFLVENNETGEAFEGEIKKILIEEGKEITPGQELLSWSVHPVKKEISRLVPTGNITLDAHV